MQTRLNIAMSLAIDIDLDNPAEGLAKLDALSARLASLAGDPPADSAAPPAARVTKKKVVKKKAASKAEEPETDGAQGMTLEDARAKIGALLQPHGKDGKAKFGQMLVDKFEVPAISQVPSDRIGEVYEAVVELFSGGE